MTNKYNNFGTVSVGNVGQLAADLVISTLQMKKVGHITDDSITPVIGNDPYAGCFSSRVGTLHLQPENVCVCTVYVCGPPVSNCFTDILHK